MAGQKKRNQDIQKKLLDFPNNTLAGFDSAIMAMRHLICSNVSSQPSNQYKGLTYYNDMTSAFLVIVYSKK
jgi:hypothetical protein